jgi:hypothetical protein
MSDEPKYLSLIDLSIIILKEEGRPMKVKEITKKILERRTSASGTPNASVCAALIRTKRIKRIGPGTYTTA